MQYEGKCAVDGVSSVLKVYYAAVVQPDDNKSQSTRSVIIRMPTRDGKKYHLATRPCDILPPVRHLETFLNYKMCGNETAVSGDYILTTNFSSDFHLSILQPLYCSNFPSRNRSSVFPLAFVGNHDLGAGERYNGGAVVLRNYSLGTFFQEKVKPF